METMKVFIGYDSREPIAYHVLSHSILRRASVPVSVTPLALNQLNGIYTRTRSQTESTEFSLSRFIVPHLSGYEGKSLFMDSDMLCLFNIAEIVTLIKSKPVKPIYVCQHNYIPSQDRKFLGQIQTAYPRKNWSSLMFFNNDLCTDLSKEYVNTASGLDLHRFNWLGDAGVGTLPLEWNYLVGENNQSKLLPKIIHWTNGGPYFPEYRDSEHADLWYDELSEMLNPCQA